MEFDRFKEIFHELLPRDIFNGRYAHLYEKDLREMFGRLGRDSLSEEDVKIYAEYYGAGIRIERDVRYEMNRVRRKILGGHGHIQDIF